MAVDSVDLPVLRCFGFDYAGLASARRDRGGAWLSLACGVATWPWGYLTFCSSPPPTAQDGLVDGLYRPSEVRRLWAALASGSYVLIGHIYHSTMRTKIGVLFLLLQLACVAYAHFGPSRYFAWAPNDYLVEFNLQVVVNGRVLSPEQAAARYRLPENGVYEFPAQHIMDAIRQYEQTYGRDEHARILLTYRLNGGDKRQWRWP